MKPLYPIVKKLLVAHVRLMAKRNKLREVGIEIDQYEEIDPVDLVLDLIGIPPDNACEFMSMTQTSGLRTDDDNLFCRDYLTDQFYELDETKIEDFILKLYNEYDELLLKYPHFFVLPESTSEVQKAIEYMEEAGGKFAIIWRKKGLTLTDACPFCGKRHEHGRAQGHRVAHCAEPATHGISNRRYRTEFIASDGIILKLNDGYWIKEY